MSIFLIMEGVFHEATILIDERPVATNRTGWTEIEVDITAALDDAEAFILTGAGTWMRCS
jgi:hypothetical protein